MNGIPELYATVVDWILAAGAQNLNETPGLWTGQTAEWLVQVNPHNARTDDFDPFEMRLTHHRLFGALAVLDPRGGSIIGPSEAELIAHFTAETERLGTQ